MVLLRQNSSGSFLKPHFMALQCSESITAVFHGRPFQMQVLNSVRRWSVHPGHGSILHKLLLFDGS